MYDLESEQGKRASAYYNGDFFSIGTKSGYRLLRSDVQGARHLLPPDADDETIGAAVMDAVSRSRLIREEEIEAFFDTERADREYEEWKQQLITRFGYKNKRALFKNMMNCGITMAKGVITISPSIHSSLEGWSGISADGADDVVIPANSSASDVGAALREGFRRCR